jgi:hypothetical protein
MELRFQLSFILFSFNLQVIAKQNAFFFIRLFFSIFNPEVHALSCIVRQSTSGDEVHFRPWVALESMRHYIIPISVPASGSVVEAPLRAHPLNATG